MSGGWYGIIDIIAVISYLLGVFPLLGIALLELNILAPKKNEREKMKLHAIFVGIFLVVAHIAMIFGMLNPSLLSMNHSASSMSNMK